MPRLQINIIELHYSKTDPSITQRLLPVIQEIQPVIGSQKLRPQEKSLKSINITIIVTGSILNHHQKRRIRYGWIKEGLLKLDIFSQIDYKKTLTSVDLI